MLNVPLQDTNAYFLLSHNVYKITILQIKYAIRRLPRRGLIGTHIENDLGRMLVSWLVFHQLDTSYNQMGTGISVKKITPSDRELTSRWGCFLDC